MTSRDEGERPDLAAMLLPLTRALIEAETPVLRANDVSMWGYTVLAYLATGPMRTQAALARAAGADKTRIIPVLDELQKRGPNAYVEGPFAGGQYVVVGPLAGPPQPPRQHRRARTHRSHRGR